MIPSKINPLGIDQNYPLMMFTEVDDGIWEVEGESTQEVRSISANLYDISTEQIGGLNSDTGAEIVLGTWRRSGYIPAKPSTYYTAQRGGENTGDYLGVYMYAYDSNKNFIGRAGQGTGITSVWITPAGTAYIRITYSAATFEQMLSEGNTRLDYQPFVPNAPSPSPEYPSPIISNYPKGVYKTNLPSVPYIRLYDDLRGIGDYKDKIVVNTQTKQKLLTKKIKVHTILTSDIHSVGTNMLNIDTLNLAKPTDYVGYGIDKHSSTANNTIFENGWVSTGGFYDNISYINKFGSATVSTFRVGIPKGVYTTATARTTFAGTKYIYALLTPINQEL